MADKGGSKPFRLQSTLKLFVPLNGNNIAADSAPVVGKIFQVPGSWWEKSTVNEKAKNYDATVVEYEQQHCFLSSQANKSKPSQVLG